MEAKTTKPAGVLDPALTTASPPISTQEAEQIASAHYGLKGSARRLPGEKDENFEITGSARTAFLKVVHAGEPGSVTNLVTSALMHLADVRPDLPVERVLPTLDGAVELWFETDTGDRRCARMTTFLAGRLLRLVPTSPSLRESLGRMLAQLGLALQTFDHPEVRRDLLWDLGGAQRLGPMLDELPELTDRQAVVRCLERFNAHVHPRLGSLRQQPVHNDFSTDNVLIADDGTTVSGVIDFGDLLVTNIVSDVAVAAVGQLGEDDDPFGPVIDMVRGYHEVVPLSIAELEVLYDLVRVRVAMYIVIAEWRSMRFPENRAYVMRKSSQAWAQLERLPESAAHSAAQRLIDACHAP